MIGSSRQRTQVGRARERLIHPGEHPGLFARRRTQTTAWTGRRPRCAGTRRQPSPMRAPRPLELERRRLDHVACLILEGGEDQPRIGIAHPDTSGSRTPRTDATTRMTSPGPDRSRDRRAPRRGDRSSSEYRVKKCQSGIAHRTISAIDQSQRDPSAAVALSEARPQPSSDEVSRHERQEEPHARPAAGPSRCRSRSARSTRRRTGGPGRGGSRIPDATPATHRAREQDRGRRRASTRRVTGSLKPRLAGPRLRSEHEIRHERGRAAAARGDLRSGCGRTRRCASSSGTPGRNSTPASAHSGRPRNRTRRGGRHHARARTGLPPAAAAATDSACREARSSRARRRPPGRAVRGTRSSIHSMNEPDVHGRQQREQAVAADVLRVVHVRGGNRHDGRRRQRRRASRTRGRPPARRPAPRASRRSRTAAGPRRRRG